MGLLIHWHHLFGHFSMENFHRHLSLQDKDTDSIEWSSITDSNYDFTVGSFFPMEDSSWGQQSPSVAAAAAATAASLTSNLETTNQIFGRDKELLILKQAFYSLQCRSQAVEQQDTRSELESLRKLVIVHGDSGSGKTALVEHALRKLASEEHAYFVTGKYEANAGIREPNAAILEAFSDLCDLTIQSSDFSERRNQIQKDIGQHSANILIGAISNVSPIWNSDPERTSNLETIEDGANHDFFSDIRNVSAFAKFMVACKSFLKALSSKDHVIVLFIDDIQWMDDGSRNLLTYILNDQAMKHIMIILAYRDEDEYSICGFLNETKSLPGVLDISLDNLKDDAVHNLIANFIGTKTSSTEELSNIITIKTRGNAFHVQEFLKAIQREGLMTFDVNKSSWDFDVDKIQCEIMVSETLADLLTDRVKRLSSDVQESLKIASLLGYRFDESLIVHVVAVVLSSNKSTFDAKQSANAIPSSYCVASSLVKAKKDGFIEKTKEGYQFSHDKLQMAFASMLEEDEERKQQYHLVIGQAYLDRGNDESMYHAAVHLHQTPSYANTDQTRIDLANVNFKAAKYCKRNGAFKDAALLLHRGLGLLDSQDKWTKHYTLSFEMTEMLSKMELIIGNYESCREKAQEVLLQAKTSKMKINPMLIKVECCMTCNEMDATVEAANQVLIILGVQMPRKITLRHVIAKLFKVKVMLARKSDEYILNLPTMEDEAMSIAVRLLLHLNMHYLFKDEKLQAVYVALQAIDMTMTGGLNSYAACAFAVYGIAELANGSYSQAYRFGKLALTLLDRFDNRDAECPTVGLALTSLTHWYDSITDMPSALLRAANRGFEIGDVVHGTYCLSLCYGAYILLGENLEELEAFMRSTYQGIQDLSQDSVILWPQSAIQYVLNLRTQDVQDWQDLTNLSGEIMEESSYMKKCADSHHSILTMIALTYKAQLSCFFGFWEKSVSIFQHMMKFCEGFYFGYGVMPCSFFGGIASYSLYKQSKKRKHLKFARKNQNTLQRAQNRGCPNALAFLTLLRAEALAVKHSIRISVVTAAYDFAIETMASEKLPHLEGLANERAAFYQVQCRNRSAAEQYFERALVIYMYDWGSIAKHDWLLEQMDAAFMMLPEESIDIMYNFTTN